MKSIRFPFGILNWLRHQQRVVKGVSQSYSGGNVALQMGNHAGNHLNALVGQGNISGGDQCYADYAVQMGQAGSAIKIDDRQWVCGQNSLNISHLQNSGLAGALSHDGSFKYFKWDTAAGCMVEVALSTPFLARFARSFEAFLQSWRLG